MICTAHQIFFG